MIEFLIISVCSFILGFVVCFLTTPFWQHKKPLTKNQLKKLKLLIQDNYLKKEDKIQKIIKVIES